MGVITSWTGADATALQQSLRMSNMVFAEHLGVVVRTVAYWHKRPEIVPTLAVQGLLDRALERAPDRARLSLPTCGAVGAQAGWQCGDRRYTRNGFARRTGRL
jgi:hypothetical protein